MQNESYGTNDACKNLFNASVSIIIVNYNARRYIEKCLDSIFNQSYKNFEVILVDNNSQDDSVNIVRQKYPSVKILQPGRNLGYPAAINYAIPHAKGEFLTFLNSDVELDCNWLINLLREAQKVQGLFTSKILVQNKRNLVNSLGGAINYLGFSWPNGYGSNNMPYPETIETAFPQGGALFINRQILEKIGLFDEDFFMYFDDVDLGWRARIMGYNSYVVTTAILYHHYDFNGSINSQKAFWLERGRLSTIFKNYSASTLIKLIPIIAFVELASFCYLLKRGWGISKLRAYLWLLSNLRSVMYKRRQVQQMRIRSDLEVMTVFKSEIEFEPIMNSVMKLLVNPLLRSYHRFILNPRYKWEKNSENIKK